VKESRKPLSLLSAPRENVELLLDEKARVQAYLVRVAGTGLLLFCCPKSGLKVQVCIGGKDRDEQKRYWAIDCNACRSAHLVNPETGKSSVRMDKQVRDRAAASRDRLC
jgi:hypothetical protein